MKSIAAGIQAVIFLTAILVFLSCNQTTSPVTQIPIAAPSVALPYTEIMRLQGIHSLHYVVCESTVVNGVSMDQSYTPVGEYFLDSTRVKFMQYYLDNHYWNVTVYDLRKNIAWYYYSGQLTYLELPTWPAAFTQTLQSCLGSCLASSQRFVGTEYVDNKLCNVFRDLTGYQEWVWQDHLLPLQQRATGSQQGIYQIGTTRKIIIDINDPFDDSVFEPPS